VKILDFGIAKTTVAGANQTGSDQILGTPRYMAPEQAGGRVKEVSPASDRFALGLVAFRLLSGRHYFAEENVIKVLLEVAGGPTAPPSARGCELGEAFDVWFERACAVDPAARFASCAEQIESLAGVLGVPIDDRPSDLGSPTFAGVRSPPEIAIPASGIEGDPTLEASVVMSSQSEAPTVSPTKSYPVRCTRVAWCPTVPRKHSSPSENSRSRSIGRQGPPI
jgi:eukaryotic-like serine/threonine-protein kinase